MNERTTNLRNLQDRVQKTIDELVAAGTERGIQVAVYRNGEQVVDAVAGVADPTTGRLVTSATPFYNFSIGKGATATVANILIDRGVFGDDTRVADIWPEFAVHGKGEVTVGHVLSHSAGVPGVPLDTTIEDLCDWDKMCAAIADAELWWQPGTKFGYHALSFGYLVGEIVRRTTGKRISEVLRTEVTEPLQISDELYFGMPPSEHRRLARLEDAPGSDEVMASMASMPEDLPMFRAGPVSLFPTADFGNRTDTLTADIPAGGKTSARAIARMYAALIGDVDGVRLLSPQRLRRATAVVQSGMDQVFGMPSKFGLGWAIGLPSSAPDDTPTAFGFGGAGGSFAYADPAIGIGFGVTKNRLTGDFDAATTLIDLVQRSARTNEAGD